MKRTFLELGFKNIDQCGMEAWSKVYHGFVLFVARPNENSNYLAGITVGRIEISLPNHIDDYWLANFDSENNK